jgi:hypothetical protein
MNEKNINKFQQKRYLIEKWLFEISEKHILRTQ